MVRIAQASRGENGYTLNVPGNQTGGELNIKQWYSYPNGGWDTLIRPKVQMHAELIAQAFEKAVQNLCIGYDMGITDRRSLYNVASKVSFDLSKVRVPCECDCSSLAAVAINAAGIPVSEWHATGTIAAAAAQTGQFDILRDSKYLTTSAYLKRGDLLLNSAHHICCVLDDGAAAPRTVAYAARVKVSDAGSLNVRSGPGTTYPIIMAEGSELKLPKDMIIAICEEVGGWGRIMDIQGWVSLSYLER